MSDATSGPLRDAYEAIRANQLPKAREILRAYLIDKPNDPDAWWLYSYAVDNVDDARKALESVLRLDSAYPEANELLSQLNQSIRSSGIPSQPTGLRALGSSASSSHQKSTATFDEDDLDDFDDEEDEEESGFSRRRVLIALGAFTLIVLLVVLVFFLLPRPTSAPEATNVAQVTPQASETSFVLEVPSVEPSLALATETVSVATELPVATEDSSLITPDAPEVSATPDASISSGFDSFYSALAAYTVVPDSIGVESTTLGQTLTSEICLQNQGELRSAIPNAIAALASVSPEAPAEAQFIGAKFVNCADNSLMRYVAVSIEDAQTFASGDLTDSQLRARHHNITR